MKVFDIIKSLIISSKLGVSWESDVYLSLVSLPESIVVIFGIDTIRGVINSEFSNNSGLVNEKIIKSFSVILNYIFIFSFIIVLVLLFNKQKIIQILYPGFNNERFIYSVSLLIFILPIVLLRSLSGYFAAVLNAFKSFYLPILATFVVSASILVCLYQENINNSLLTRLAIGNFAGNAIYLLILFYYCIHKLRSYKFSLRLDEYTILIFRNCLTTLSLVFVNQIYLFARNHFASYFEQGAVASLNYSLAITGIINLLIFSSTFSVIVTNVSEHFSKKEYDNVIKLYEKTLGMLVFIASFVSLVFIINHNEILYLLYKRGNFDELGIQKTIQPFIWDSIAIFGTTISTITTALYLGSKQYKLLSIIGISVYAFGIFLIYLMSHLYGYIGIPISGVITMLLYGILLMYNTKRFIQITTSIKRNIIIILFISIITYLIIKIGIWIFPEIHVLNYNSYLKYIIMFILKCIFIIGVYVLFARIFKIEYYFSLLNFRKSFT